MKQMTQANRLVACAVDGFRNLQVSAVAPGVFSIRYVWKPWRTGAAEIERTELLRALLLRSTVCALWLDARFKSLASTLQPLGERAFGICADDWCGWFVADAPAVRFLAANAEGGWGCLFFDSQIDELPKTSPLPYDPIGVLELQQRLKAQIAIVSELDDAYWLVAGISA